MIIHPFSWGAKSADLQFLAELRLVVSSTIILCVVTLTASEDLLMCSILYLHVIMLLVDLLAFLSSFMGTLAVLLILFWSLDTLNYMQTLLGPHLIS